MDTTSPLPSLFLSHGAPDILLSENDTVGALRDLAVRLPKPRAIVIVSAHWVAEPLGVTAADQLPAIHDFGGFPDALYGMRYPARGDPLLAADVVRRLRAAGFAARPDEHRGLDHGAWIPLKIMYPEADVPVVQVSLPAGAMEGLVRLGATLEPLRQRAVLIIGSGGSVHNLRALNRLDRTDDWAAQFERWLHEAVEGNHFERLVTPAALPATFPQAHPTTEHYAPLLVAWAAGNRNRPGRRVHHGFSYGNLGMSCFEFGYQPPVPAQS